MTTTLFVCHEGQRTGAPLQLLWLIRWLVANTTIRPVVALMRDGPLREDFTALCPTHTFSQPIAEHWTRRIRRRIDPALSADRDLWLASLVERIQPDCLYLNTLVLGSCLTRLRLEPGRMRVLSHGHELEIGLRLSATPEQVALQLACTDRVICCGEAVRRHLIDHHQVAPERCVLAPVYLPVTQASELRALQCDAATQSSIDSLRRCREEGLFLFGIAGSPIDRKGFDLFPQLIRTFRQRHSEAPFRAVWVGCGPGSVAHLKAERDLSLLGVREHALLLPGVSCGPAALRELDVLMLLSREDPYPVVALEAGALGIPTVCFRHSGDIADLAEQGYGKAVDYLDLEAFADAIACLRADPDARRMLGARFSERVLSVNTVEAQAPGIAALIQATD